TMFTTGTPTGTRSTVHNLALQRARATSYQEAQQVRRKTGTESRVWKGGRRTARAQGARRRELGGGH
ncbi:MAG: hypothetical protein ACK55Z_07760, partial [bacterium]